MLRGIDISNWQSGFDLAVAAPEFVIVKATEGTGFVDSTCYGFVQTARQLGIPFGFYHFARSNDATAEAAYFYQHTKGYVGQGIPILDLEVENSNEWLDAWCRAYHKLSGVYPWVYMNSDYVNNRGYGTDWVKQHCALWMAGYPISYVSYPEDATCPYKHDGWSLAAWQFTSSLWIQGRKVDGDFFYGSTSAWAQYVKPSEEASAAQDVSETGDGVALTAIETWQLARSVINGDYGNGEARRAKLGANYDTVQACVNMLLQGTDKALAQIVMTGAMGNGQTRRGILGSRYSAVQAQVNVLCRLG